MSDDSIVMLSPWSLLWISYGFQAVAKRDILKGINEISKRWIIKVLETEYTHHTRQQWKFELKSNKLME
jgi:hypothetical protein